MSTYARHASEEAKRIFLRALLHESLTQREEKEAKRRKEEEEEGEMRGLRKELNESAHSPPHAQHAGKGDNEVYGGHGTLLLCSPTPLSSCKPRYWKEGTKGGKNLPRRKKWRILGLRLVNDASWRPGTISVGSIPKFPSFSSRLIISHFQGCTVGSSLSKPLL